MQRRGALMLLPALGGAAGLSACGSAEVQTFPTVARALAAIESLRSGWRSRGAWSIAQVLEHAAQSIDYSLRGFPQAKPAWFQATAGSAAFAVFDARGKMSHALDEPIPGAPALEKALPLDRAIERAMNSLRAFEAHTGALQPHFAYGALDKAQYTRAHLMHLANHWTEFTKEGAKP